MIVGVPELGRRKHMIHGLVEVDLTSSRQFIREFEAEMGCSNQSHEGQVTMTGDKIDQARNGGEARPYPPSWADRHQLWATRLPGSGGSISFCGEFDGRRRKQVLVKFVGE